MILLNFARMLIAIIGLLLGQTFRLAYNLTDMQMIPVAGAILFVALCVIHTSDAALIAYFNPDTKA